MIILSRVTRSRRPHAAGLGRFHAVALWKRLSALIVLLVVLSPINGPLTVGRVFIPALFASIRRRVPSFDALRARTQRFFSPPTHPRPFPQEAS